MRQISSSFAVSETLPDGRELHIRAIRPGDRDRLHAEFRRLSPTTVRDRFFSVKRDLTDKELDFLTDVDFCSHVALVAEIEIDRDRQPAAVGRFVRNDQLPGHAEMAITVTDRFQGLGIGSIVMRQLIACARDLQLDYLDATAFAENSRIIKMMRRTGLPLHSWLQNGVRELSLTL